MSVVAQRRERLHADRMEEEDRLREPSGIGSKRGPPSPPDSVSSDTEQDTQRPCLDSVDGKGDSKSTQLALNRAAQISSDAPEDFTIINPDIIQPSIAARAAHVASLLPQPSEKVTWGEIQKDLAGSFGILFTNVAWAQNAADKARQQRDDAVAAAELLQQRLEASMARQTQMETALTAASQTIVQLTALRAQPEPSPASAQPPSSTPSPPRAALPPPSPRKAPSFAQVASSAPIAPPTQQQRPFAPRDIVAEVLRRRCFRVQGPAILKGKRGKDLNSGLEGLLKSNLGVKATVSNALVLPSGHFFMELATIDQARAVVKARHLLKGSGYGIFDMLSPEEQAAHNYLWPTFVAARKHGHTAQFHQASLVVSSLNSDGTRRHLKIWAPPFPSFGATPVPA